MYTRNEKKITSYVRSIEEREKMAATVVPKASSPDFYKKNERYFAGFGAALLVGAVLSQSLYTFTSMEFSSKPGDKFGKGFDQKKRDDCLIAANVLFLAAMLVIVLCSFSLQPTDGGVSDALVFTLFLVAPQIVSLYYSCVATSMGLS